MFRQGSSARPTGLETAPHRTAGQSYPACAVLRQDREALHLGYYRGAASGSWAARRHRGVGHYETDALGIADERLEADGIKVLDF
jgi:hypothetical protein